MSKPSAKKPAVAKPIEPVVTRHKSAQEGRQLRNKDRSMKSITQLLKSSNHKSRAVSLAPKAAKSKKSTAKKPQSRPKSPRKKETPPSEILFENEEIYPNIAKRNISEKKVFLKPKYDMKVIARTNKRKLKTPQKGSPLTTIPKNDEDRSSDREVDGNGEMASFDSEMTMADFVRMAEEADCLDDDDLMEILTCPSPVWWEDPPDDNYMEDPIVLRIPTNINEKQDDVSNNAVNKSRFDETNSTLDIVVRKNDTRLEEKTKKLEKILGNLKSKFYLSKANEVLNNSNGFHNRIAVNNNSESKEITSNDISKKLKINRNSDNVECDDILSDIIINGEELLRDLENMDIPIQHDAKAATNNTLNNSTNKESNNDNNVVKIKLIDKNGSDRVTITEKTYGEKMKNMKSSERSLLKKASSSLPDDTTIPDENIKYLSKESPSDLTKPSEKKNVEQRKSEDSSMDNTQFFVDKDMKQLVTVSKDTESMCDFEKQIDKSDCITVYKIKSQNLSNDGIEESLLKTKEGAKVTKETAPEANGSEKKLNVFYKKRKNSLNNGKEMAKKQKTNAKSLKCNFCRRNTFLTIPDSDKKLCLGCSSIYEESCTFCEGKDLGKCTCSFKQTKLLYSCKHCEYQTENAMDIRKHVMKHPQSKSAGLQSWYRRYNKIHFT